MTEDHSCSSVELSADSNTDKDSKTLRCFEQQLPVRTEPAHWVSNSNSCSVCAAEFVQVVSQAQNWPSRDKALLKSTHTVVTQR